MKSIVARAFRTVNLIGLLSISLLIAGCSKSLEDLPRYKSIDLQNMGATLEVLSRESFKLIEQVGIYGTKEKGKSVSDNPNGYKAAFTSWGSIESLRKRLIEVANAEKPIAFVGKYNDFAESTMGFRDMNFTYYNANCWSNPQRNFNVNVMEEFKWKGYDLDEPTREMKQSWGEFDCVVTGLITDIRAVGATHACDAGGFVRIDFQVHEIFNKQTGKRVWPPVE